VLPPLNARGAEVCNSDSRVCHPLTGHGFSFCEIGISIDGVGKGGFRLERQKCRSPGEREANADDAHCRTAMQLQIFELRKSAPRLLFVGVRSAFCVFFCEHHHRALCIKGGNQIEPIMALSGLTMAFGNAGNL